MCFNMLYNAENREKTYGVSHVGWLIINALLMVIWNTETCWSIDKPKLLLIPLWKPMFRLVLYGNTFQFIFISATVVIFTVSIMRYY